MPTPSDPTGPRPIRSDPVRRNARVALICGGVFVLMVGAAFASVPLYKRFCQVTGFDGTVRRAEAAPTRVLSQTVNVKFDTNVRGVPWAFKAEQNSETIKLGETGLAYFTVENTSDHAVTGRAAYNVLPETAGPYFQKLECFCFTDQTIPAHTKREFPVAYFVDPKFADDFDNKGVHDITLSYTFFPVEKAATSAPSGAAALGGSARPGL
jgi:cytochrome c oxidase assembly protein subunit 11